MALLMREARLVPNGICRPRPAGPSRPTSPPSSRRWPRPPSPPVAAAPPVPVLRDYHAENLIWLPRRRGHARVGMLDYQDMLVGHPAYDLVSLLEDARRDIAAALRAAMLARYLERSGADPEAFAAAAHVLAAQRNLKILGLFTRLCRRDGKPRYLGYLPRVWAHLARDLAHPALAPLAAFVARHVPAARAEVRARIEAGGMTPAGGDDLRRRARHPDGRADPRPAEAADRGRRPAADRPRARRSSATPASGASSSTPTPTPGRCARISPGSRPRRWSRTSRSGWRPAAASKRALPLLGPGPVFTLNADMVWRGPNPLAALAAAWGRATARCSASCRAPRRSATPARATSSSARTAGCRAAARRRPPTSSMPAAQIIDPAALGGFRRRGVLAQPGLGRADRRGRLRGVVHPGGWVDVGRPEGIALAEAELAR